MYSLNHLTMSARRSPLINASPPFLKRQPSVWNECRTMKLNSTFFLKSFITLRFKIHINLKVAIFIKVQGN